MSNVHEAITKHSQKQHEVVKTFLKLDLLREEYIEEAITLAKNHQSFSVEKINRVTNEINNLAKKGIVPLRKLVSNEMVLDYVKKLTNKKV
ncbi:YpbS family protein [Bacillus timonensis]|nr:YpbS family protein [Bacillus timonensis]